MFATRAPFMPSGAGAPPAVLSVSVTPGYVTAYAEGTPSCGDVTANIAEPVVSNGTGPFSYTWTLIEWGTNNPALGGNLPNIGDIPTISNANIAQPSFTARACFDPGQYLPLARYATWRLTVTDATAATATFDVGFSWEYVDTNAPLPP